MLAQALNNIRLSVTVDGAEHQLKLKPGDLAAFEEHFDRSLFDLRDADGNPVDPALAEAKPELVVNTGFGMRELAFLSWRAVKRDGIFDGSLEEWLDAMDDIGFDTPEGSDPPT